MKKAFYLSLMAIATIFTLALATTTIEAQGAVEEDKTEQVATKSGSTPFPRNFWIPYNRGGFGTFGDTATSGNEGMHNMVRAMISSTIYDSLSDVFDDPLFPENDARLGYRAGDSVSKNFDLITVPVVFERINHQLDLGYSTHRGWNNVWRYQSSGNLGAGMHERGQNMAWFNEFSTRTIRTVDQTIELAISYVNPNQYNVTITRLRSAPSTNPAFRSNTGASLPIGMNLNRWNGVGTRVNDYTATDNVAIININTGPIAAFNIRPYLQTPPQITIETLGEQTIRVNGPLEHPSNYVRASNMMAGGNVFYQWVSRPDTSRPGTTTGTIEAVNTLGEYIYRAKADVIFHVVQ